MIKKIDWLTFASLMALSLGAYTSMSFLALSHIFIIIPVIYFLPNVEFKTWKKSQWALLGLIVVMLASIFFNQDIAVKGYAPIPKLKYYLLALFSIVPVQHWYDQLSHEERTKKIKIIIQALFFTSIFASLYGLGRIFFGLNIFHMKFSDANRNTGLNGMVLNFAHNLVLIEIFASYCLINRKVSAKFIGTPLLILIWVINFISLYATYSRGAILAFFIAVPFIFILKDFKKFAGIVLVAVAIFATGYFIPSLKISRPGSDYERLSQWQASYAAFKDRPILGQGYLNFEQRCPEIKIKYDIGVKTFCGHAHNNFLEIMADTGIFGFLFFILWFFFWILELFKRRDLLAEISLPLIVAIIMSGMTQATFTLGANLFLIMGIYTISMIEQKKVTT